MTLFWPVVGVLQQYLPGSPAINRMNTHMGANVSDGEVHL